MRWVGLERATALAHMVSQSLVIPRASLLLIKQLYGSKLSGEQDIQARRPAYICMLVPLPRLDLLLVLRKTISTSELNMLGTPVLLLALAATVIAQAVPEGYRRVVITSNVDKKFVVVPKARTAGSTTVV